MGCQCVPDAHQMCFGVAVMRARLPRFVFLESHVSMLGSSLAAACIVTVSARNVDSARDVARVAAISSCVLASTLECQQYRGPSLCFFHWAALQRVHRGACSHGVREDFAAFANRQPE